MQWHLLGSIKRGIIENARQDLETNIRSSDKSEWTIEAKSQGEPRGERDVIRLRNPTEDKRAFRRMLTSADQPTQPGPQVFSSQKGSFLTIKILPLCQSQRRLRTL